ncbi:MAG: hypothetical protein IKA17_10930 [Clostridia bacterium]|nr:hypothetical protein [Clostridia bacterium]
MKKGIYIDLMERVMSAYTDERITKYTENVIKNGLEEHGYPRLTANLGILIAHGRKTKYKDEFRKMMDLCCREIPTALGRNGCRVGNDFSVKELVFCLLEIEKAGIFDKSVTDGWRNELAKINPYETYSVIASVPPERINNWAAFGAVSEQVRKYAGIGDESSFIENQIKSQLFSFDENGMYRDPNEPMVYDTVTRLQLALTLYFGFDGESKEKLEKELLKSADMTLNMQSVTGEIPFGGRSAQFLHNEAHFAALCEFYADLFGKCGDLNKAGQFKSAARIALESITYWLKMKKIYHVKNYYDNDSMYGCEEYSYFDKYMVTASSMLYAGYIMADDNVDEVDCPAISENAICETSEYFHKVMCRYKDYFVEFETMADHHYDASGIGRIHKRGVPSAICLSVPFSEHPNYEIDIENPSHFSVCTGIKTGDGYAYTFDASTKYKLVEKMVKDECVQVKFECETCDGAKVFQTCILSDDGVEVRASGNGDVRILFVLFDYDGEQETKISVSEKSAIVSYKGSRCVYSTNGVITDMNRMYANRNGHYRAMAANGKDSVSLKIEMF